MRTKRWWPGWEGGEAVVALAVVSGPVVVPLCWGGLVLKDVGVGVPVSGAV